MVYFRRALPPVPGGISKYNDPRESARADRTQDSRDLSRENSNNRNWRELIGDGFIPSLSLVLLVRVTRYLC